jgi:hypothetical protein
MMTIAVSAGLFQRVREAILIVLYYEPTRLAYFCFTSKFGNRFALNYFSRAMSLDLEDIKVTDVKISESSI